MTCTVHQSGRLLSNLRQSQYPPYKLRYNCILKIITHYINVPYNGPEQMVRSRFRAELKTGKRGKISNPVPQHMYALLFATVLINVIVQVLH